MTFNVDLDKTLRIIPDARPALPDWTALSVCKCPVCPLDEKEHPRCPVAVNLVDVIEFFKDEASTETVDVEIEVTERTYSKKGVPLSNAVSGLIGIIMASSACPVLGRLRPMVGTHLPFASRKETLYRTLGMYMIGQFFKARRKGKPDLELKGLMDIFDQVKKVNRAFCQRLRTLSGLDANLNAIVHLDCFTDPASFVIKDKGLDEIEATYDAFFDAD